MKDWTGDDIKALRTERGWTQAELAERLGLPTYDGSAPRIGDMENGRREPSGPVKMLLTQLREHAPDGVARDEADGGEAE